MRVCLGVGVGVGGTWDRLEEGTDGVPAQAVDGHHLVQQVADGTRVHVVHRLRLVRVVLRHEVGLIRPHEVLTRVESRSYKGEVQTG
jgi:hypothetical protein